MADEVIQDNGPVGVDHMANFAQAAADAAARELPELRNLIEALDARLGVMAAVLDQVVNAKAKEQYDEPEPARGVRDDEFMEDKNFDGGDIDHRFYPTIVDDTTVNIGSGWWGRNEYQPTWAGGDISVDSSRPYVIAKLDDEDRPTTLTVEAVAAVLYSPLSVVVACCHFDSDDHLTLVTRHQLGDMYDWPRLSDSDAKPLGTASPGYSPIVSRWDHVHPTDYHSAGEGLLGDSYNTTEPITWSVNFPACPRYDTPPDHTHPEYEPSAHADHSASSGLTGANYNGSAAVSWSVDFSACPRYDTPPDHTHPEYEPSAHADHSASSGLTGANYNGSAAVSWSVDFSACPFKNTIPSGTPPAVLCLQAGGTLAWVTVATTKQTVYSNGSNMAAGYLTLASI